MLTAARVPLLSAAFVLIELGLGLTAGQFWLLGRAETTAIMPFRALAIAVTLMVMPKWPLRRQAITLAIGLVLAALVEGATVVALGNPAPWAMLARDLAFGTVLALATLGMIAALPRRAALSLALGLAIVAAPYAQWQRLFPDPRPRPVGAVQLITGVPLLQGEGSIAEQLSGTAVPSAAGQWLARHYRLLPVERLSELGQAPLLLVQPQALSPAELVAIDGWINAGGRALILADPMLRWQSRYPLGDARRPPITAVTLAPLLLHWGIRIDPSAERGLVEQMAAVNGVPRRLAMATPGVISAEKAGCRITASRHVARCAIGHGTVVIVADADLLDDRSWVGAGRAGETRDRRLADNPQAIAGWLGELGLPDAAADDRVAWITRKDASTESR